MAFRVGQKVVCVDASPVTGYGSLPVWAGKLQEGVVYTVRRAPFENKWGNAAIAVCELDSHPHVGFKVARFRPLIEKKTDTGMSILRKVADDASKRRELTVCGND